MPRSFSPALSAFAVSADQTTANCDAAVAASFLAQDGDRDEIRLRSYDLIVQAAARLDEFQAAEVREMVGLEGRLVNQVLRLLTEDGLIVRSRPTDETATQPVPPLYSKSNDQSGKKLTRARRSVGSSPAVFRWTEKRRELASEQWARSKVFSNRVTRAPLEDRPRERLLSSGAASLRIADLIAILIRSGNARESAVQAGERVAAAFSEQLDQLSDARRGDLREISTAVGETAYCQIMAGIELGRRVAEARNRTMPRPRIQSTDDARAYCADHFRRLASDSKHEEFHLVLLNTRYEPIGSHRVSSGTLDASLVHPREVFRPAIKEAAKAILLVHNHPSGDPTPGEQDIRVTRRLNDVSKLVGIDILDHIVVAASGTFSLRDAGLGFD